jgi:two-component system sensor kinase FixL
VKLPRMGGWAGKFRRFIGNLGKNDEQTQLYQARLEAILDNIVDGLITIDEKGTVQSYNKACEKIFGYAAAEVIDKNINMLMPQPYMEQHDQYLRNYMGTGKAKIIGIGREVEGKRKDGSTFPLDLSVAQVKVGGKRIFSGIVRDISERKYAEEALVRSNRELEESEARLRAVVNHTLDGLITIDTIGTIGDFNPACERIFGYQAKEVIGQNIKMLMPEPYHSAHDNYLSRFHETGKASIIGTAGREVIAKRKDGSLFPMDLSISAFQLDGGQYFSGIVRDITERKQAEEALVRTNQELEKFAYVASHDLKAPLRNIDDLAKWVQEDTKDILPPDAQEKMKLLCSRVKDLENLLDDILSYSRAGRIIDSPVEVDTQELVSRIAEIHAPGSFDVKIKGKFPVLFSPRTALEQIFGNLISNAVKHHDRGKGTIEIESFENGNFQEFVVRDDGPGILPEFHERVFQMFQTLQSRDKVSGSGLGLAIVKKLVEWQGGRVWIESKEGSRGTAIHFLWARNLRPL